MKFKELIKTNREKKGMTQQELAEEIGVSKQTIANWENERSTPELKDQEIIDLLRETLNISKNDIVESITRLNLNEEDKQIINYPFLPNELMNIKLSKEEIEVLFAMEYLETSSGEVIFYRDNHEHSSFTKKELYYKDYINILGTGRNVLLSKKHIKEVTDLIDMKILLNIIRKNNLTTFDIQKLSERDIYLILQSYKTSFNWLMNNDSKLCYFNTTKKREKYYSGDKDYWEGSICTKRTNGVFLVLNDKIYRINNGNQLAINDEDLLEKKYAISFDSYFVPVELVPKTDAKKYELAIVTYNEELKEWERKMVEIKKLQDLYDAEKYPDLPKPKEPEKPSKKLCYELNYKGILLRDFFEKMDNIEEGNNSDFVENARIELAPYLDEEISIYGTLTLEENNSYLFKSLYLDGKIIDHLWIYDVESILTLGKTYKIKGTVNIYTKEVDGKDMKNYGIKVKQIDQV